MREEETREKEESQQVCSFNQQLWIGMLSRGAV